MKKYSVFSTQQSKVKANSWVIADDNRKCILIDTNYASIEFVDIGKLIPVAVFLTHEHYDHCEGLNELRALYEFTLITSSYTNTAIGDPKKNLSVFEDGKGFAVKSADIVTQEESLYNFMDLDFNCWLAKGHSAGGMIIRCGSMFFTGDTVLNGKTPTLLPTGSKKELEQTLEYIDRVVPYDATIYPGHGVPFARCEWSIVKSIGKK